MIETFAAEGFPLTFFPSQVVRQMRKIPSCPISGSLGRLTFTFLQGLRCVCMCVCVWCVLVCYLRVCIGDTTKATEATPSTITRPCSHTKVDVQKRAIGFAAGRKYFLMQKTKCCAEAEGR